MARMLHVGSTAILAALGVMGLGRADTPQEAGPSGHDYPTSARVEYVQACMVRNGGQIAFLYKCPCALDRIAKDLTYDDFVEWGTLARNASLGGERALAEELPVLVILGLGEHDALAGNDLRRLWIAGCLRLLDRRHQCGADVAHDFASGRLALGVQPELAADLFQRLHVGAGLLEVLIPFLAQFVALGAGERRRVKLHSAAFVLQRLQQEYMSNGGFAR